MNYFVMFYQFTCIRREFDEFDINLKSNCLISISIGIKLDDTSLRPSYIFHPCSIDFRIMILKMSINIKFYFTLLIKVLTVCVFWVQTTGVRRQSEGRPQELVGWGTSVMFLVGSRVASEKVNLLCQY